MQFGKIKVRLFFNEDVDDSDIVTLRDGIIEADETSRLYRSFKDFPKFNWKPSPSVEGRTKGRLNTTIIVGAVVYYAKLGWFDLFRLKWMFGESHFQKHWEFWAGAIILPAISLIFAARAGILTAIAEWIRSIRQ